VLKIGCFLKKKFLNKLEIFRGKGWEKLEKK